MARSWRFNLGVGFLLWLAALAVLAQGPTFAPASRRGAAGCRRDATDAERPAGRVAARRGRTRPVWSPRGSPLEPARVAAVPT